MAQKQSDKGITREEARRIAAREKEPDEVKLIRSVIREELDDWAETGLKDFMESFFEPSGNGDKGEGKPGDRKPAGGFLETLLGPKQ